jgi:HlyD family secretion protein
VARGDEVRSGDKLFAQDDVEDRAALDQAIAAQAQERAKLADLEAPSRTPEISQAQAELSDVQAAHDRVARDLARNEAILASGAVTRQSVDQLRDDAKSARSKIEASQAKLAMMMETTGSAHAIVAQQAAVLAATASQAAAQWHFDQRHVAAPAAGRIADSYAKPGETIGAGVAVVSLLPPANIFVRFFVPETALARVHPGDWVAIACDSCPPNLFARISFVATQSEYTPPVIYSQGTRGSLVYLIEAFPDPNRLPLLKPGQPVDVRPDVAAPIK